MLLSRGGKVLGIGLLTLVAYVLVRGLTDPYDSMSLDPGFLMALGLVGAGVLLLRSQEAAEDDAESDPRVARPRSPLGVLTLAVLFFVVGLMILLGNLSVADLGIGQFAAAGLLMVGVGLLVGTWWGRSRLLIAIGIALVPIVIAGGFMNFPLRGTIGGGYMNVRSINQVEDTYEILAGSMQLDLLRVKDFPARRTIDFEVAAGNVTVYVPERIGLTISGTIDWGNASVGRGRQSGEDISFNNVFEATPGAGHLEINFHGGIASFYVERISYRERFGSSPRERRQERREQRRRKERRQERREERRQDRREERRQELRDERRRRAEA